MMETSREHIVAKYERKRKVDLTFRVSVVRFLPEAITFPSSTITQLVIILIM